MLLRYWQNGIKRFDPIVPMDFPIERFDQLGLSGALLRRLNESGHDTPSHIQSVCIPPLLSGRDLLSEAHAGTGRTLAFVLPLLQTLTLDNRQAQVLVLTPSDQVSLHVAEVFQRYARYLTDFHVLPINHQSSAIQSRQMRRGAQVIVGTPRRIMHFIEEHGLDIASVTKVIFDAADEMLREGFGQDIQAVLWQMPAIRQRAIFSATLPRPLRYLANAILHDPLMVKGTETTPAPSPVRQRHWQIGDQSKLNALARLIEVEPDFDAALVFVHDTGAAADLAERLLARGYAAAALDGNSTPEKRLALAEQLERGELDLLIGTDHATRDILLNRITHSISYDIPCDSTSHAFRISHAGHVGHRATAVVLVTAAEMGMLHSLEHATRQAIPPLELPERIR